jgi:hypothetical protein
MSDKQCEVIDGEVVHDWKRVSCWRGDPGAVNGTAYYSYLECRVCGEENHSHSSPDAYEH